MKLVATTALAVLIACPAFAGDLVVVQNGLEITVYENPACEDSENYQNNWAIFQESRGLNPPIAKQRIPADEGGVWIAQVYENSDGYRAMFGYKDGKVCLLSTARPLDGDPT